MPTKQDPQRTEAIAQLRKLLKPGARVYTTLRHVSSSGMSRRISVAIPVRETSTYMAPAVDSKVRVGLTCWATVGARRFSYARIASGVHEGHITLRYDDGHEATHDVRDVQIQRTRSDLKIRSITWLVAKACGYRLHDGSEWSIVMGGCGMDMGFAIVYDLGRTVWPKGTSKPHSTRNGTPDRDGGYALNHEWL